MLHPILLEVDFGPLGKDALKSLKSCEREFRKVFYYSISNKKLIMNISKIKIKFLFVEKSSMVAFSAKQALHLYVVFTMFT